MSNTQLHPSLSYQPAPNVPHTLPNKKVFVTASNGSSSKTFRPRKGALMEHSGYFKIALSGRWELNNNGHIKIEDEPWLFEVFSRYAHTKQVFAWMYTKHVEWRVPWTVDSWPLKLMSEEDEISRLNAEKARTEDLLSLPFAFNKPLAPSDANSLQQLSFADIVDLYTFADRRDVPRLSDMAISLILEKIKSEQRLPASVINGILYNTAAAQNSLMFGMFVELAVQLVSDSDIDTNMDDLPREFLVAVLRKQKELAIRIERELNENAKANERPAKLGYGNFSVFAQLDVPQFLRPDISRVRNDGRAGLFGMRHTEEAPTPYIEFKAREWHED
jgi:hypothetical protein